MSQGASLEVQWLRLCTVNIAGSWVPSLVWELDPTSHVVCPKIKKKKKNVSGHCPLLPLEKGYAQA